MGRQIPREVIDELTRALNMLSQAAQKAIAEQCRYLTWTDTADLRRQLIEILEPYFAAATDSAAAYAAESYDDIRQAATGSRLGALAEAQRNAEATEQAIRSFMRYLEQGGLEEVIRYLCQRMDYEIKKAAANSTLYNTQRDPARPYFARVPTGSETCNFCLMMASRGFVYYSKESAGALDHWHPSCDCRIVPGFDGQTEVAGYDPEVLRERYNDCRDTIKRAGEKVRINDVLAEMRTRDPKWLSGGPAPKIIYEKPSSEVLPKERDSYEYLSNHGFPVTVLLEDPRAPANIDMKIGSLLWELKNPGGGKHALEDRMRDAVKKWEKLGASGPRIVVCNSESGVDDEIVYQQFVARCDQLGFIEGLFISADGSWIKRWKKQ